MKKIIVFVLVTTMGFFAQNVQAQKVEMETSEEKIEVLKARKDEVVELEKKALKREVRAIMNRLDKGEITEEKAEELKKEVAEKRALNIENRIAVLDNQIALLERNGVWVADVASDSKVVNKIINRRKNRKPEHYRRTRSDFVFAFGLNNTLADGRSLDDSPYRIGGSRFAELGWAWTTRVFEDSGWLRVKYGFSFQFNGLKLENDQFFVRDGDMTVLQEFDRSLDKSKLRIDNLVFPVHFEFGPSRRKEKGDDVSFSTHNKFKIGLGGYAGFNIGTVQKLKFDNDEGDKVKQKSRGGLNTNNLVYGLSGYLGYDNIGIYVKYDLNPVFKDNLVDERNISLGLRFDLD
ncbi:hypothetical protein [Dokdonia pacifica]|uniref:Outer membrane protein beta-barrel domain-containing protein n=1 Tax=Dokdonia pacifica TaxID=1627892 RepID=A0A239CCJ9_9FLAO|nr:hypothetical protein [Dokdonia pacifica]SNS17174.1 hypothetical protein SAMN06265376_107217 [Dokdonia pacifica]